MSKKLLLIALVIVVVLAGGVYFLNAGKTKVADSPSQNTTTDQATGTNTDSQLSELSGDWQTYTAPEGFSINHPSDIKINLTQEGTHFLKLGPSQATGTELFDGLSLLVYSSKLNNVKFEDFVQKEYNKVKNDPIYESVSELKETPVSTYSGYSFVATGIGTGTTYFLKDGSDGYIKIVDMTVEPADSKSDFRKTATQMLNSFQIHSSLQ